MLAPMTTLLKAHLEAPISGTDDLIAYLARGARPREQWAVGTEMEKLVIDAASGEAAPFSRIEALLQRLEQVGSWQGVRENGRLIALLGPSSSITLEPGGQLELSGELCFDLHCSQADFSRHISEIVDEAAALGLAFLGLGTQPFTPLEQIDWLPKARYGIMGPYMARTGDMGQRMMKQSAGLQVNFDFSDEADCIDKLRIILATAPLQYALFANSPLLDGKPSGFLSSRGEIWSRTDPDRTGLLPQIFAAGAGFATYVDYALDVPMYFISRGGAYVDFTRERFSFRRYLAEGFQGQRATLADWDLHLSTLFPEARLRPQIETRSADALPPQLTLGVAALLKGLLYDGEARAAIWSLVSQLDAEQRQSLYRDSWRLGLKAPFGRHSLRELALEALAIARESLRRQQFAAGRGLDETVFLDGIDEIARSGVTLAERMLGRWQGSREQKVQALLEHCGFR